MNAGGIFKLTPRARSTSRLGPAIRRDATGLSLYALRPYASGDLVLEFRDAVWRLDRDQFTVEHPSGAHLFHPLLARAAHRCSPNGRLDIRQRALLAARPIVTGDRITIDYRSTERRFSHPFDCLCGVRECVRRIG